jgi:hypothetical protein
MAGYSDFHSIHAIESVWKVHFQKGNLFLSRNRLIWNKRNAFLGFRGVPWLILNKPTRTATDLVCAELALCRKLELLPFPYSLCNTKSQYRKSLLTWWYGSVMKAVIMFRLAMKQMQSSCSPLAGDRIIFWLTGNVTSRGIVQQQKRLIFLMIQKSDFDSDDYIFGLSSSHP